MGHHPPTPGSAPDDRQQDRRALAALAGGLALFALAVLAARATLPEWRAGELPSRDRVAADFVRAVAATGGEPASGDDVRVSLTHSFHQAGARNPYQALGTEAGDWLLREGRPLLFQASGTATTADGVPASVVVHLGLDGRPWNLTFGRPTLMEMFTPQAETALPTPVEVLLGPDETLGEPHDGVFSGNMVRLYPVVRPAGIGVPPEYVAASILDKGPATVVGRGVGAVESVSGGVGDFWTRALSKLAGNALLFVTVAVVAFALALRRRIDLTNAALLTALATAVSVTSIAASGFGVTFEWIEDLSRTIFDVVFLFILWASAESLLRDVAGESTNGLDLVRRGRVDRRVGRAALWGLGVGGAIATAALGAHCLVALDGPLGRAFMPASASVGLPSFGAGSTPFDLGIRTAGELLLFLALALQALPRRWAIPAAVAAAALMRTLVFRDFTHFRTDLAVALVAAALLAVAFRRSGSLAALIAGITAFLLPAFAFSAHYPGWLGGSLAGSVAALLGFGALGLVGLRGAGRETRPVEAPPFVARLEEERRVSYEMELLRRMQVGLLPHRTPDLPGWQLAARSKVAHEVGGDFYDYLEDGAGHLWIAAGDVAGHGSFCSISHAMTKAALASLVAADRTPAGVLAETDRVLRTLDARRIFTALALVKLDPATGRALFANAGYPFPLVRAADGSVREIELPGLPLGQGPTRDYRDLALELAPGDSLVLVSDGLVETGAGDGEPYGFDRYRAHLGQAGSGAPASAETLLQELLARWREAVGDGPPEDDTTVVVIRRDDG